MTWCCVVHIGYCLLAVVSSANHAQTFTSFLVFVQIWITFLFEVIVSRSVLYLELKESLVMLLKQIFVL